MGGLGPGIGGLEYLVIGIVALVVVGPEKLPGMLRQLGKMVAKARGMANDFRASFDEMARQSELDELRKEVQALRDVQGSIGQGMVRLGDEANAAFKDIKTELDKPAAVALAEPPVKLGEPEFPEPAQIADAATAAVPAAKPKTPRAAAKPKAASTKPATTTKAPKAASTKADAPKPARPRAARAKKTDQ